MADTEAQKTLVSVLHTRTSQCCGRSRGRFEGKEHWMTDGICNRCHMLPEEHGPKEPL
eukprot:gene8969-2953_t